jgi:hypothetical protein
MSAETAISEVRPSPPVLGTRKSKLLLIVATTAACLVAGTVSWLLVQPGEGLLWPLAMDLLIAALFGTAYREMLLRSGRAGRIRVMSMIVGLAVVSMLWTYFGVLPASVNFDSAAATVARTEVAQRAQGCRLVESGSVGLLGAPYKICTNISSAGSMVMFATPDLHRGYAYIVGQLGSAWFPDQCARHLIGSWWAFFNVPATMVNGCPLGYSLHGGG